MNNTFKVVSCNIRGAFGVDGENEFCYRKEAVAKYLLKLNPDIIGFQELNHKMRMELLELMPAYAFLGAGREKNRLGESSAIAYRQSRLMPERLHSEILSPTPHLHGTTYGVDQSKCPRIFSSCDFMPIDSDTPIRFISIHTDHQGKLARILESEQLLAFYNKEQQARPMPTVIVGDFNATPDSTEIKVFSNSCEFTDATADIKTSFHEFGNKKIDFKIDYIFISKDIEATYVGSHRYADDGRFLSDHDLIEATLKVK